MTVYVSLLGVLVGVPIGILVLITGTLGTAGSIVAKIYVSYFRGVPLLVQLLVLFNFLPWIKFDISATAAAVTALGLITAAYVSEILRGTLHSIPPGQSEAAATLGYGPREKWQYILLPQIIRLSIPALFNELTLLLKSSSLISVVGIAELTRVSQNIVATTFRPVEIYLLAAGIYIVMSQILLTVGRLLERHWARR